MAKRLDEQLAGFIIAHHADRQNVHPEISQIVDSIRSAAGRQPAFPVLEN